MAPPTSTPRSQPLITSPTPGASSGAARRWVEWRQHQGGCNMDMPRHQRNCPAKFASRGLLPTGCAACSLQGPTSPSPVPPAGSVWRARTQTCRSPAQWCCHSPSLKAKGFLSLLSNTLPFFRRPTYLRSTRSSRPCTTREVTHQQPQRVLNAQHAIAYPSPQGFPHQSQPALSLMGCTCKAMRC